MTLRDRSEQGFTIVEVLVGVIILSMVMAGIVMFIAGAGKSQQKSQIRQKMAATAEALAEQVRSTKDWVTPACKQPGVTCRLPQEKYNYQKRAEDDPNFESVVTVTAIDSPVDGLTIAQDKDRILPDLYRISVTISLKAGEEDVWGKQKPYQTVSTIDSTMLGKGTGTLVVQTCKVTNQVDERMAIAGCKNAAQKLEMRPQPACKDDEEMAPDDVQKNFDDGKFFALRCNAALEEAKDKDDAGKVSIEPMNVQYTINGTNGTNAMERGPEIADMSSSDGSTRVFTGMGAGDYQLNIQQGGNDEIWVSHTVPDDLKVAIQNNQEARAMIIVRPKQGTDDVKYEVRFKRNVYIYKLETTSKTVTTQTPAPVWQAAVQTKTEYTYLKATMLPVEERTGPSWNGYIAMEAKPFDRYRQTGSDKTTQYLKKLEWKEEPNEDDTDDEKYVFSKSSDDEFPMATGLHSLPSQIWVKQEGRWGQWDKDADKRDEKQDWGLKYDDKGIPEDGEANDVNRPEVKDCQGNFCGEDFVWINADGSPNSYVEFFDEAEGECYVESDVSGISFERQLAGGGDQPTGSMDEDRCQRDMTINGVVVEDFLPDRDGKNGKTVVWRAQQTTSCVPAYQCTVPGGNPQYDITPTGSTTTSTDSGELATPGLRPNPPVVNPSNQQIATQQATLGFVPAPPPGPAEQGMQPPGNPPGILDAPSSGFDVNTSPPGGGGGGSGNNQ